MQSFLEKCGLQLKESKTRIGKLEEGTEFLGYRFDSNGKMVPVKAYNHLEERLEECWLQNPELPIEEKMRACKEIIGGWEQYYKGDRTPGSIYEYVTVLSLYPKARRKELENEANFTEIMQLYTDVHCYNKARQILDWVKRRERGDEETKEMPQAPSNSAWNGLSLSEKELQDFQELFVGREDLYKRAEVQENGKINYIAVMQPLTIQELQKHLAGNQTMATIIQSNI